MEITEGRRDVIYPESKISTTDILYVDITLHKENETHHNKPVSMS